MTAQNTSPDLDPIHIQGLARLGPKRSIIGQAREQQIVMDISKARGGDDSGPTPPECLALSLAGCVLNLSRLLSEQRGLQTVKLAVVVTGTIDPAKAFGLESQLRAGFQDFWVTINGTEGWPQSERSALVQALEERCPVCDNLANPTEVHFQLGYDKDLSTD